MIEKSNEMIGAIRHRVRITIVFINDDEARDIRSTEMLWVVLCEISSHCIS
jgi:hypothetical protein